MQIRKSSNTKTYLFIAFSLLFLLVFGLFLNGNIEPSKKLAENTIKNTDATEIATTRLSIAKLIEEDRSYIFKNEDLYVFAAQEGIIPKITFAYKSPLEEREIADLVFLHVYLKDSTLIKTPYYNFTFPNPGFSEKLIVNGEEYQIFTKNLTAKIFDNGVISFQEIDHINIGRFNRTKGRSLDLKKLVVNNVTIEKNIHKLSENENLVKKESLPFNTLNAYTKAKDFEKIKQKREGALKNGILLTTDNDLIKGSIGLEGKEKLKTNFRLKGDWTDHLNAENQWSYRFIIEDENTLLGMRKLSLQHPKTRNYQWEWLLNKVMKDEGIMGLRYDFVHFNLHIESAESVQVIDNKIMALEESFDKILIENNKKREGVIIAFDESMLWNDREQTTAYGLNQYPLIGNRSLMTKAKIKVFNENKVLANPELKKQYGIAKDLLEGLRDETYKISEVFDMDKLTTFVALYNVFGGGHGLTWHNLRIYYNPITNKLEPICFDSVSGQKITELRNYPFTENDPVYKQQLAEKLKTISSQTYIDTIINEHGQQLNQITDLFQEVYPDFIFDIKTLAYNSNVIKKFIYPVDFISANFIEKDGDKLLLEIDNLNNFSIIINSISGTDGKRLSDFDRNPVILQPNEKKIVTLKLKRSFNNAFVSKKNKKGGFRFPKDLEKIRVNGEIQGIGHKYTTEIGKVATNQNIQASVSTFKKAHEINYTDFPFVEAAADNSQIIFKKGNYVLSKDIKLPAGKSILIEPGFHLDFTNNASLISKSSLIAEGTSSEPITFSSKDGTGGGLFIDRTATSSTLVNCVFDNLSNPHNDIWSISGAVNFNESDVSILNCTFKNNRCEDGLNIIRSNFTMTDSAFYDTYSDSFDGDFVTGTISNCQFYNAGNDAIDVSGSKLTLIDILIENPLDKGISAGEASTISGNTIKVKDGEIGIVSKDLSSVTLIDVVIENTRLGFSAFQKKSEYGKAEILINQLTELKIETSHLIENGCKLTIDNIAMPTVSNSVIDQMYGAEYGKSSK